MISEQQLQQYLRCVS